MTWSEHVKNGEAYSAEDFILGVGGLFPHLQLFNPVGSGVRIRLRSVHTAPLGAATVVNVRRYGPPGPILGPPAGFVVENLLGGGPPAVAEIRSGNIVVRSGSAFWFLPQGLGGFDSNTYPPLGQEWGHDLLENNGVLVHATAGITLIANWQWVELPL